MAKNIAIILAALVNFCANINLTAQKDSIEFDTTYIQSFRDYLVITAVSAYNSNSITLTDNSNKDIIFATNLPFYFGAAVDYKWLTLEYTKNINTSLDERMGKTRSRNIGLGITGRKIWFRAFWKDYQGYYMQNPEYDNPEFNGDVDTYPLRTDLHTLIYFANLNYGFNHKKFSNTASLWQLEKQKKSAGSFTAGLSVAYMKSDADSALVLTQWEPNFSEEALITNYKVFMIGINGGYLYTFSMFKRKRFFLSLAFIPGVSYQYVKTWFENKSEPLVQSMAGVHAESRVVFGYIHNNWYTSVSGNSYSFNNFLSQKNSIVQGYSFLRIVFGRKFKLRETKSPFLRKIGL